MSSAFDKLVFDLAALRVSRNEPAVRRAEPRMSKALARVPRRLVVSATSMQEMRSERAATGLDRKIRDARRLMKSLVGSGRLTGHAACEAEAKLHHLEALRASIR